MAHRQIEFAFLHESRAELEIHIRIVRMRGKRNLEFSNRLIESMGPEEKLANGEMGIVVPICHCQCAVPKPLGVVPIGSLNPGPTTKSSNNNWSDTPKNSRRHRNRQVRSTVAHVA